MTKDEFDRDLIGFLSEVVKTRPEFENRFKSWPILNEDTAVTSFDSHYIYHVAWAMRKVLISGKKLHVDFSSSLNFCTNVSAICETVFYDYRPAILELDGLSCKQCDLTSPNLDIGKYDSISCMHVIEHIGLGRYGDKLDCNGDLKAINNLKNIVLPGGDFYFVVPCGRPSVQFNAHRVYNPRDILHYMGEDFQMQELYFISGIEGQAPIINPSLEYILNCDYGCGCFHFKKKMLEN